MVATKKKTASKKSKDHSFTRIPNAKPFLTLRFTEQTVYWLILCLLILALGIWVNMFNMRVQSVYDEVHLRNSEPVRLNY